MRGPWPRVATQIAEERADRLAVETVSLDVEVAAIHQCVTALEVLDATGVARVLAYVGERFKPPYKFEDDEHAR